MKLRFFSVLNLIIIICLSCNKFNWNLIVLPNFGQIVLDENNLSFANVSVDVFKGSNAKNATYGFCISEKTLPTINDSTILVKPDNNISKLKLLLKWGNKKSLYIRAFVKNDLGINYSDNILKLDWPPIIMIPKVSLKSIDSISFYFVDCSAKILNDGGLPILSKGFIISKEDKPTMNNSLIFDSKSDLSIFSNRNSGLVENTIYNVRAFIKNTYTTSLSDEVIQFKTENFYEIGEIGPGGGLIFYSNTNGSTKWHFLESSLSDYNDELKWSLSNDFIQGLKNEIGFGFENTELIIDNQGKEGLYASLNASEYSVNDYTDWFLPSRDELRELISVNNLLGKSKLKINEKYWSSSQDYNFNQNAWIVTTTTPVSIFTNYKLIKAKARFIRRF